MLGLWMLAATAFALLVGAAALGVERVLRARHWPTRAVWLGALGVAFAWPPIAWTFLARPAYSAGSARMGEVTAMTAPLTDRPSTLVDLLFQHLDVTLLVLWGVVSVVMLLQTARAVVVLHRIRHRAVPHAIDGDAVLVSDSLGPAVIGLRDMHIVIPAWLLDLDAPLRALVLRHEREHRLARDPWLVWLSVAATTIAPWNAGLWFITSRLRLAMEVDCDARTLVAAADRQRYAKLLLLIAQRGSSARFAPMLAHSRSQLARRITVMTAAPSRRPIAQALVAGTVAALALVAACSNRVSDNLMGPAPAAARQSTAPIVADKPVSIPEGKPYFEFQVDKPAVMAPGSKGPMYPASLRAARVEGAVLAQFVVNPDGKADMSTFKVLRTADPLFAEAVRASLVEMQFMPAMVGGRAVKQLAQQPFQFSLGEDAAAAPVQPRVESGATLDQQAAIAPGAVGPAYPPTLRAAGVQGSVVAQVIINADGTADMSSLKVLRSPDPLFTESVKTALAQMKFSPATVKGRAVRQLMQLPFEFSLQK
ncbi:M56 family metallopeptidase [Gemmatimonas groenlandica]|uniref:TonB family protein n=1 Tax=Gemmatimonas groenlandica TaxID=2732249 RepID=A0A6M4IX67_9BACT|nr:M56 family metallopeptidase [Gemmatimonas groenlandica]QJR37492.1 TonB family protein [Gemmatimonas groenlandica]